MVHLARQKQTPNDFGTGTSGMFYVRAAGTRLGSPLDRVSLNYLQHPRRCCKSHEPALDSLAGIVLLGTFRNVPRTTSIANVWKKILFSSRQPMQA